jgi:hypothetical protein
MPAIMTQAFVDKAKTTDKRQLVADGGCKGLYLDVRQAGKSFRYRYTDHKGVYKAVTIGDATVLKLAEARDKALKFKRERALGVGIGAEPVEDVPKYEDFVRHCYMPHALTVRRAAHKDWTLFNNHLFPVFGHKRLNEITRADIGAFMQAKRAQGYMETTCNRLLARLKATLISEPYLTLERKGIDAKQVSNRLHIIMASNEDWVVPANYDSRRFAVFAVSSKYKQNSCYFTPLYEQINNGGREAFLHVMLNRDISDFHPRQIIKTAAFKEQVIRSLDPKQAFWLHWLEEGYLPIHFGTAPKDVWYTNSHGNNDGLLDLLRRSHPGLQRTSARQLASFLREKGCEARQDTNRRGWKFPPLAQARADWENQYGKSGLSSLSSIGSPEIDNSQVEVRCT